MLIWVVPGGVLFVSSCGVSGLGALLASAVQPAAAQVFADVGAVLTELSLGTGR